MNHTIHYVGVNDHITDLFEGQYRIPQGISYNSYLITDEKIAVMDTVDLRFAGEWLQKIRDVLGEREPDYLIVQHMEPDHAGSIHRFMEAYPGAAVAASSGAFVMMKNFFGTDFAGRKITVGEGDSLSLGGHTLHFVTAPMVHWPEVIMSYESTEKVLFSADAFGRFGALDAEVADWVGEARRYFIGIVGKFGAPVQAVLKKAAGLDIQAVYPLHGPVVREDLGKFLSLYQSWSTYTPEEEGVVIAYTSVYGNTRKAALQLAELLQDRLPVAVYDLARCDMSEAGADAFRYSKLVLATTTYNGSIFPFMHEFIQHLTERNFSRRKLALIENGSWAPTAAKVMKGLLEKSKDLSFAENEVKILSALNEVSDAKLKALADELCR